MDAPPIPPSWNEWQHITVVFSVSGNHRSSYKNGAFIGSYTPYPAGFTPTYIALHYPEYTNIYSIIDEVYVYNRALNYNEIVFNSANPSLPITDGLVLWLPLDEGSSTPFKFTIGEKYPLTITAYTIDGSIITQATTVTCSG